MTDKPQILGYVQKEREKNGKKFAIQNIDGLDSSQKMLKKAAEKQAYLNLTQADLTSSLNIPDNQYDAVISVGTFTCAHVGPVAKCRMGQV